jgi:CelD/BcsL family acetyltransferase involved in cellulose biosynthesis
MAMLVSSAEPSMPAENTANKPSPKEAEPRKEGIWIEIAEDAQSLQKHLSAWDDLAKHALEPNVFLESWIILPAIKAFGAGKNLLFAFLYRANPSGPQAPPILCGFFPLERTKSYKGLPVSCLRLWEHDHCFVGTPLLHKDHARETLQSFLDWLAADARSSSLFEFPLLPAEGKIYQLLVDEVRTRSLLTFQESCFTRAMLRVRENSEAYLQAALSGNRRRDYKRKEKRFTELGKLEYRTLDSSCDLAWWLENFLTIEANGWKGQEGTALACNPANKTFFLEAAAAAFQRGQLHMLGLFLDGKPIAIRCNFLSGEGSFFFKPAYDETHSKNSPGALVELQNIHQIHALKSIRWMDSCTSPDNTLLNDLWLDRIIIQTLVLATNKGAGRFALSLLPLCRWFNRKWKRKA